MNVDELQEKIFAAARALPSAEQVPYGFEQRILALVSSSPAPDVWAFWSRLLWRAAAPCVGIMVLMSAWTVASGNASSASASLAADLERTVWGPLSSINESW
jgi:hypothetical protein